jgi:hypothetical protein
LEDLRTTQRLVVVDDSKSANRTSDRLVVAASVVCDPSAIVTIGREFSDVWFRPNPDAMTVDAAAVLKRLGLTQRAAEGVQ